MAAGETVELTIERLSSEGAGVGRVEGRPVFVEGTAPAERVRASILEERSTFSRAGLAEILEPGASRVEPPCPHYGECGGCSLQHVSYAEQLSQKTAFLRDALVRVGGIGSPPEPRVFPSEPYGYRNRMQFHRASKPAGVGLKKRSNEEVLPIRDCPVADAGIREALRGGRLVPPPWKDRFNVFSRDGLLLAEGGRERGEITVAGKTLALDVGGFFQSNVSLLETLLGELSAVAETAGGGAGGRALDLYCGVGTFGAFLADRFGRIDLVEPDPKSAALARENVRGAEVRLFAFRDDDWARRNEAAGGGYDLAVVDPPRVGLSRRLRQWLAARPPELLVYVSCDPATLARDSKELLETAYELRSLSLYDFYPQTPHVESLAVFGRRR